MVDRYAPATVTGNIVILSGPLSTIFNPGLQITPVLVLLDSMSASDSRFRGESRSALQLELASAEMSLHAIYMHEVGTAAWL